MDWNRILQPGWLSLPWVRQGYTAAVVGLAVFCVSLSLTRLEPVRSACEAEVYVVLRHETQTQQYPSAANLPLEPLQRWLASPAILQAAAREVAAVKPQQLQLFPSAEDPEALIVRAEYRQVVTAKALAEFLSARLASEMKARQQSADHQERQRLVADVHAARQVVAAVEEESQALLFAMRHEMAALEAAAKSSPGASELRSILMQAAPAPPPPQVNPQWVALQKEVETFERHVNELRVKYTPEHPLLKLAEIQFEELKTKWEQAPKFEGEPTPAPPQTNPVNAAPELAPPDWPTEEGPVANIPIIKRTSAEEPTQAAPVVRQYLTELAECSTELAAARQKAEQADAALKTWEIRTATNNAAIQVSDARVVEDLRRVPKQGLVFVLGLSFLCGGVVLMLGVRWNSKLQHTDELATLGLPVLSTIWGRRPQTEAVEEDRAAGWQRYTVAGAEFVLGAFVAAYIASCYFDPNFAALVGRDPLAGICELWVR